MLRGTETARIISVSMRRAFSILISYEVKGCLCTHGWRVLLLNRLKINLSRSYTSQLKIEEEPRDTRSSHLKINLLNWTVLYEKSHMNYLWRNVRGSEGYAYPQFLNWEVPCPHF